MLFLPGNTTRNAGIHLKRLDSVQAEKEGNQPVTSNSFTTSAVQWSSAKKVTNTTSVKMGGSYQICLGEI